MQYRTQAEWVMPESAKLRTSEKEERLKEMLAFIHKEYRNEISLSDIADAAKVTEVVENKEA